MYELELVYPIGAAHSNDIVTDCYIKAKPNQTSANQLFHIYKVSKPINGEFTVYAEHVSYILSGYPVPTVSVTGNAQVAINAILTAAKNQRKFEPVAFGNHIAQPDSEHVFEI